MKFALVFARLGFSANALATTITCKTESSVVKSELTYSFSPMHLSIRNVTGGREFASVYLAEDKACGEAIASLTECELSEIWDSPARGNYGASFGCKSGQHGDLFFENGAIEVQCVRASGERMQRTMSGCVAKP